MLRPEVWQTAQGQSISNIYVTSQGHQVVIFQGHHCDLLRSSLWVWCQ